MNYAFKTSPQVTNLMIIMIIIIIVIIITTIIIKIMIILYEVKHLGQFLKKIKLELRNLVKHEKKININCWKELCQWFLMKHIEVKDACSNWPKYISWVFFLMNISICIKVLCLFLNEFCLVPNWLLFLSFLKLLCLSYFLYKYAHTHTHTHLY